MIKPEDLDDPTNGVTDQLLNVFCNAWASGFATAHMRSALIQGHPRSHAEQAARAAERVGQEYMRRMIADPAATDVTLRQIRYLLAGVHDPEKAQQIGGAFEVHTSTSPIRDEP